MRCLEKKIRCIRAIFIEEVLKISKKGNRFMKILRKLKEHKSFILYVIFGVLTTVVNMAVYGLCYDILKMSNIVSTVIAWFAAVVLAYATNKVWVFNSKSFALKVILYELATFFSCRILTGILDVAIMYFAVDIMAWNGKLFKLISNVLVIILNFIASKLIIFVKK